jgi:hypothetical protein
VYYVRLERCCSTAGVAAEVAAGVLPEGCWVVGAIELGVRYLVKKLYWGLMLLCWYTVYG